MLGSERRRIGLVGVTQTSARPLGLESAEGRPELLIIIVIVSSERSVHSTHTSTHREIRHAIMPMTIEDVRHVKMGEPDCSGKVCA